MLFGDDALDASDAPSTGGEIARELSEERRHLGVVHGALSRARRALRRGARTLGTATASRRGRATRTFPF